MATSKKPIKKAQNGATKKPKLLTVPRTREIADSLDNEASRKTRLMYRQTEQNNGQATDESVKNYKSSSKDSSNAERYRKLADQAEKKLKSTPKKKAKSGASIAKAKDGKWMQKAAASIKRRGTEGKCTPITKPGCTGRAKALAKTFKKIAKSNKKK